MNRMRLSEVMGYFIPPYKTVTIHVRSLKFAQIWYFCLMKSVIDIANDEVHGMPKGVKHYVTGKMLGALESQTISISDMLYGDRVINAVGDVIYLRAKKYFRFYRKQMGLKGPRRIRFGERIFMLEMTYWYRYSIPYTLNVPLDLSKNMNTVLDKYGAKNFGGLDEQEYVTYDHKVEMYLWNKLIRESVPEYKGVVLQDILDPMRENWKVVYDGPEVLELSDAPRKPIPVDYTVS